MGSKPFLRVDQGIKVTSNLQKSTDQEPMAEIWPLNHWKPSDQEFQKGVCMCMYVHMSVHTCLCVWMHVRVCECMFVCVNACSCVSTKPYVLCLSFFFFFCFSKARSSMSGVCLPIWACLLRHKTQQRHSNSNTTATRTVPTGIVMERTRVRGTAVGGGGRSGGKCVFVENSDNFSLDNTGLYMQMAI